ncbi:MAG: restriction endonuclease [Bacteroidia bacterium]|jgi:restriction system protein|nr:restriction endonuclease [Bacteroidia bacterium]
MPIPTFQEIMLPLLTYFGDNNEHKSRETIDYLANHFNLSEEEKQRLLPSGTQAIFDNRVGWAKTHIAKAGLLESPRRSVYKITESGRQVLAENPPQINVNFLQRFPSYIEFIRPSNHNGEERLAEPLDNSSGTPEEILENSYSNIRRALAQDLLTKVKQNTPAFFERLVVELLVKMGYGGSLKDAGRATRLTNDQGIDGIIKEDKLGLDVIYIQAKRWDTQSVGRPDIQSFVGALDGQRANKGIFITTSHFANSALEYVNTITKKVILIDGEKLADYMIEYGIGVSTSTTYEIKKMDNDYFGE